MNKISMMIVASGMLAATSCSDFNDYNTAPNLEGMAGKTLWQNIGENENLSDFANILKKVKFDETLSSPSFYTVFAPLNGTFNVDSVLALQDDVILKEFVKQHVVEYNHPIIDGTNELVLSLNAKNHSLTSKAYGEGVFTSQINQPASNGLMHIINKNDNFYCNAYEYYTKAEGCSKLSEYILYYDQQEIDEANSIEGPIVDGKKTYEHIEYKHWNSVLRNTLHTELENEDSIYTVIIPNDEAWDVAYETIKNNYNYLKTINYMDLSASSFKTAAGTVKAEDSKKAYNVAAPEFLTDSLVKRMIIRNTVFSHGYPGNKVLAGKNGKSTDTLYSSVGESLISAEAVDQHTLETYKMSNGSVRIVDALPFRSWESYNPIISVNVTKREPTRIVPVLSNKKFEQVINHFENKASWAKSPLFSKVPKFLKPYLIGDKSPDKSDFVTRQVKPQGLNAPELDYALNNVLSTTYHIYVVTVPNDYEDTQKAYYLNFYLNYTDANNKQIKKRLDLAADADASWGPTSKIETALDKKIPCVVTEPGVVNVIDLGEVEFPVCYAGLDAYPNLMIFNRGKFITSTQKKAYEQGMNIAGIFLVPVEADTYLKNEE